MENEHMPLEKTVTSSPSSSLGLKNVLPSDNNTPVTPSIFGVNSQKPNQSLIDRLNSLPYK